MIQGFHDLLSDFKTSTMINLRTKWAINIRIEALYYGVDYPPRYGYTILVTLVTKLIHFDLEPLSGAVFGIRCREPCSRSVVGNRIREPLSGAVVGNRYREPLSGGI
ncbi:hypothetical protein OSB04_029238 [Centaurea solstitialis]|uniref:Uncharacterized protein n=1 Tax=Centaurea solstitialis TaxID=347529 RepID=A0AA38W1D4_9ASTR|nr:hypothetical protein OSB04_029238 [Centaurea solstitialis]